MKRSSKNRKGKKSLQKQKSAKKKGTICVN